MSATSMNTDVTVTHACTLQEHRRATDPPTVIASVTTREGEKVVELLAYHLREEDDDSAISDVVTLSWGGWCTLVEMFALRYPESIQRMAKRVEPSQPPRTKQGRKLCVKS